MAYRCIFARYPALSVSRDMRGFERGRARRGNAGAQLLK